MENENWKEYLKAVFGDKISARDMEKMFLANPADAFAIYQLRDHESTHDHRFLSMSQLQAAGLTVERTNYEVVYAGALHHSSGKATPELLNDIFYRQRYCCAQGRWRGQRSLCRPLRLSGTARFSFRSAAEKCRNANGR